MASQTPDHQKIAGIKAYLLRTYVGRVDELKQISDNLYHQAVEDVTIVGTSADGGSANGEVTFPKWLYIDAVEQCIAILDPTAVVQTRSLGSMPDFSGLRWSV